MSTARIARAAQVVVRQFHTSAAAGGGGQVCISVIFSMQHGKYGLLQLLSFVFLKLLHMCVDHGEHPGSAHD